uniref:Uncharacterized protein n=1 Tax=Globodera rostochiensis TaxID=31243 RepID=A0A914H7P0_GLORO
MAAVGHCSSRETSENREATNGRRSQGGHSTLFIRHSVNCTRLHCSQNARSLQACCVMVSSSKFGVRAAMEAYVDWLNIAAGQTADISRLCAEAFLSCKIGWKHDTKWRFTPRQCKELIFLSNARQLHIKPTTRDLEWLKAQN